MSVARSALWVLCAFALAVLAGCGRDVPRLPPLAPDAVVLAFGDSLTHGTGAPKGESYPAHLERLIGRRVIEAGVPGEVSAQGVARLAAMLDEHAPALLLLCHGGNDILRRMDLKQTAENLRSMIRMARDRGVAVVLIAVPQPGLSLSPTPFYREVAKELGVPLEERALSEILADRTLKADTIHPNAAGYQRLATAVAALLRRAGALN